MSVPWHANAGLAAMANASIAPAKRRKIIVLSCARYQRGTRRYHRVGTHANGLVHELLEVWLPHTGQRQPDPSWPEGLASSNPLLQGVAPPNQGLGGCYRFALMVEVVGSEVIINQ